MSYRGSGHPGVPVERNPGAVDRIPPTRPESRRLRRSALVWNLAWEASRRLPEPLVFALADVAARIAHRCARRLRERVRTNFVRVVGAPAAAATARQAFRSYARYWVEAFRAADISADSLDRRTTTEGFEHLDGALEQGRGAIVLLAHHGSWDTAARWAETHGYHLAVVAEVVRPRALFRKFVALREAIGLEVVPLTRGSPLVGRLADVLAANHLVGLLTDRDLSGKAPVVAFFGAAARVPVGALALSQRTGAPILPAVLLQRPRRRWHLQVLAPVDIAGLSLQDGAQRIADALEAIVRTAPEQWHAAFSRVWLDQSADTAAAP